MRHRKAPEQPGTGLFGSKSQLAAQPLAGRGGKDGNESVPHMRADEKKRVLFGVIAGIIPEAKNKYEQHLTV